MRGPTFGPGTCRYNLGVTGNDDLAAAPAATTDDTTKTSTQPKVTVVVPTKDSIRVIETCLRSIKNQTYGNLELIVVDNYSTDGTWEIARELADVAITAGPERSAQRNLGVERAQGEWILWIDSDMDLPPKTVELMIQQALETDADGVFAPESTIGDGYWTACRALERSCCWDEILVQAPRLVKREYLLRTGGFLSSLAGTEDAELRTRMREDGCTLTSIPDLIVHDEGRMSLGFILKKRYYYGRGLREYKEKHPGALNEQAGAAVKAYLRHWRKLAADPGHTIGVVFMRGAEFIAYGVGYGIGSIGSRSKKG
jgi:glycosyltransferase involved in cell wall biosynthesis